MSACTWCANGARKTEVPGDHVALFACVHEHMSARPICADCVERARRFTGFICSECAGAGVGEDEAVSYIVLVCTRAAWMDLIEQGKVRFLRERGAA